MRCGCFVIVTCLPSRSVTVSGYVVFADAEADVAVGESRGVGVAVGTGVGVAVGAGVGVDVGTGVEVAAGEHATAATRASESTPSRRVAGCSLLAGVRSPDIRNAIRFRM